jgi:hypothetical protein
MAYKNMAVNKGIVEGKVLLRYVRDSLGYKKGALIAIKGEDGIISFGLSLMNPIDRELVETSLSGIPAFSKMLKKKGIPSNDPLVKIIESAFNATIKNIFGRKHYSVPDLETSFLLSAGGFDRDIAVNLAYSDAKQFHGANFEMTLDKDAQKAAIDFVERASRYFKTDLLAPGYADSKKGAH